MEELRQQLTLDIEQNFVWRHETILLLTTVVGSLDLLLIVTHAPHILFRDFLEAFERNKGIIEEKRSHVPLAWLDQHPEVADIVPFTMDQVELLKLELQGALQWGQAARQMEE